MVLASASPRRHRILTQLGYRFEVRPADADETPPAGRAPEAVAEELALRKARKVAADLAAGTVVGADTIVVGADGTLLGKPEDAAAARRILRALSATTHRVITGVAVLHRPTDVTVVGHEVTRVTMRAMTDAEIDEYVASGESFGKAGAYAIQEHGDRFVTRLEGDYDNVVGFPGDRFLEIIDALRAAVERAWKEGRWACSG